MPKTDQNFLCLVLPKKGDDSDAGATWGYVFRSDGIAMFTADPQEAETARGRDEAEGLKIGHSKEMGGAGFRGQILTCKNAKHLQPAL